MREGSNEQSNVKKGSGMQTRKNSSLKELYEAESITMSYGGLLTSPILTYAISVLFVSYWFYEESYLIGDIRIWWALMLIALSLEALIIQTYKKANELDRANIQLWQTRWASITIILGVCFNFVFFLVDVNQLEAAVFILAMHGFNILSSSLYVSLNPRSLPAYLTISLSFGGYAFWGTNYFISYLLLSAISLAGCFAFSVKIKNLFSNSILLRFKNEQLIKELKSQKEIAESASASKTKFLAAASHDLRQPLQSLSLLLAALASHSNSEKQQKIIDKARLSQDSLSELLDSLLDMSKLDAHLVSPNYVDFNLKELLQHEIEKHNPSTSSKNLTIQLKYEGQDQFTSDPILITRIVSNLVSNAYRYTNNGSIEVKVHCDQDRAIIDVTDTGIGIANDQIDQIFNEFYQVHNPERDRTKGLGLGLSIVKRLCMLIDAEIDCISTLGRGSRFKLSLKSALPNASSIPQKTENLESGDIAGLRVLLIDDEVMIRESMTLLLESWDCEAVAFSGIDDTLAYIDAENYSPEALIVDYRLRDHQTGTAALEAINKKLNRTLPSLIITGDTAPEKVKELEDSDLPFLHKPIEAKALLSFLNKVKH